MGFFDFLFDKKTSSNHAQFRRVDWHAVEGRWVAIDQMAKSNDQAQKKQAIIQADMLIDDIFKQAGVAGNNMGERLKMVAGSLSKTVYNQLWQAHKKRNELVHESGSFVADWEIGQYLNGFRSATSELRGKR